jgi:hypothetical protein
MSDPPVPRPPVPGGGAGAPAAPDAPEEPVVERVPRATAGAATVRDATARRRRAAFVVALAADLVQWGLFPLFMAAAASPLDDVLDVAVALVMVRWVGWHWAFLPAFVAELVPFVDLVPFWTLAAWFATRGRAR